MFEINIIKSVIKGTLTFIPGISNILEGKKKSSKHSGAKAEFCYAMWMGVLKNFEENGIVPKFQNIGELGCGGSVGLGICAVLSGVEKYTALEIEDHFDAENNLKVLNDLVSLLKTEAPVPQNFAQLNIKSANSEFPKNLVSPNFNNKDLIQEITDNIKANCLQTEPINILYGWDKNISLKYDLIFSRAVMEHVDNPRQVYTQAAKLLRPGGFMFHDIELHAHGLTKDVNGHLKIPGILWRLIKGRRKYFMNRLTIDKHIEILQDLKFSIIDVRYTKENTSDAKTGKLIGATILAQSSTVS